MVEALDAYHPLFAHTGDEARAYLWDALGGTFRNWALVLQAALARNLPSERGLTVRQSEALLRGIWGPAVHQPGRRLRRGASLTRPHFIPSS
jgi:hypothetical protein